jgi:16S rRNA (cytidine1402-2'-O)-methyltransferase
MPGTLFVVATPIGNLEDISARALRVLREVALIAAEDTRHTGNLLNRFGITTRTTSLHEHNEREKSGVLIDRLKAGESIALVSDAGTPTVSDPGTHLIREAIAAGLRVEPIPGPNAAIATLSVSGLPNHAFTFLGFPPTKASERGRWFEKLRTAGHTVIFYESPHRIVATLTQLQDAVGDVSVAVGRELTKTHEELVRGPISHVISAIADAPGEFTVVVDIGETTNSVSIASFTPQQLSEEFGLMTNSDGLTKRRAIALLARRHRIGANEVYAALEQVKRSVIGLEIG